MRRLFNFGQNRSKIQKLYLPKRYASLLLVPNAIFPAWNNSKVQHIVTLFPLTHKGNSPILYLRKTSSYQKKNYQKKIKKIKKIPCIRSNFVLYGNLFLKSCEVEILTGRGASSGPRIVPFLMMNWRI